MTPPVDPSRELTMTRTFLAPRELMLKMFSTPEMLTNWWGPHGFSIETDHMDFRAGGSWKFTMIGPDGTRFPNLVEYLETGPDRIAWNHSDQKGEVNFKVFASLRETEKGKTTMEWRMIFQSAMQKEELEQKFGAREGLVGTLSRLDALLAQNR